MQPGGVRLTNRWPSYSGQKQAALIGVLAVSVAFRAAYYNTKQNKTIIFCFKRLESRLRHVGFLFLGYLLIANNPTHGNEYVAYLSRLQKFLHMTYHGNRHFENLQKYQARENQVVYNTCFADTRLL